MLKDSSAVFYKKKKKGFKKELVKVMNNFLKKKKRKKSRICTQTMSKSFWRKRNENMVVIDIKIFLKRKTKVS